MTAARDLEDAVNVASKHDRLGLLRWSIVLGVAFLPTVVLRWNQFGPGFGSTTSSRDATLGSWFLGWVPFSLTHLQHPLVSPYLDVPHGVNLMINTSYPLLGLLGAPVTWLFGAGVTFSLWLLLSGPLTVITGFILANRYVRRWAAALIGAVFLGYSPYVLHTGISHLQLSFFALVPLFALVLDEVIVRQRWTLRRSVVSSSVLVIAQMFIGTEVLLMTAIVSLIGLVFVAATNRDKVAAHIGYAAAVLWRSAALCLVVLAYPLWLIIAGPGHFSGPAQAATPRYRADVVGLFTPTSLERLGPASLKATSSLFAGNVGENVSYLGPMVFLGALATVIVLHRRRIVQLFGFIAVSTWILSLGSPITVANHVTAVPGPGGLLNYLPLFESILLVRFAGFTTLACAMLIAIGIDALLGHVGDNQRLVTAVIVTAVVAVLIPIIPVASRPAPAGGVPSFFTTSNIDVLGQDPISVVYPFPGHQSPQSMSWQLASGFRFKQPGGYVLVGDPRTGQATFGQPSQTARAFETLYLGGPLAWTPALRRSLQREWSEWKVTSVLAVAQGQNPSRALSFLKWATEANGVRSGGVTRFDVTKSPWHLR